MRLYSVIIFRTVGSSVQNDQPELLTDQTITTHDFQSGELARIDQLNEGESYVIRNGDQGFRITRLPDYQSGRIMYDSHAKEYVRLSNGRCVLDHSSPEAFRKSHTVDLYATPQGVCREMDPCAVCQYAPSEAIALRVSVHNGKLACAWTYRAVNPCDLRPVSADIEASVKAEFEAVLSRRRSARFIGRI